MDCILHHKLYRKMKMLERYRVSTVIFIRIFFPRTDPNLVLYRYTNHLNAVYIYQIPRFMVSKSMWYLKIIFGQ